MNSKRKPTNACKKKEKRQTQNAGFPPNPYIALELAIYKLQKPLCFKQLLTTTFPKFNLEIMQLIKRELRWCKTCHD